MKFFKKNKITIIAICLFLLLILAFVWLKSFLVPDEGKAAYGNRLTEISKHPISDETFSNIENKVKEDSRVIGIKHNLHGKIINYMITVNNDVSINDAKGIASSLIPLFADDQLSYYSLQVYVLKEDSNLNNFPIVGYKGTKSGELIFSKDREITTTEEKQS